MIDKAINSKSRKIPYSVVMEWFKDHTPENCDSYEYLSDVFDEETGFVKESYLEFMLQELKIFERAKEPSSLVMNFRKFFKTVPVILPKSPKAVDEPKSPKGDEPVNIDLVVKLNPIIVDPVANDNVVESPKGNVFDVSIPTVLNAELSNVCCLR